MSALTLYDHPVSSYAQKIRIALREKNIPFTAILPTTMSHGLADKTYAEANPRQEVPTLIDGSVQIFDSTIILEYVEEKYPSPALLPSLAEARGNDSVLSGVLAARAKARMIEDMCDTTYEAVNWGYGEIHWMGRADHDAKLKEKLAREAALQTIEIQAWLAEKLGEFDYFGGEFGFGWADVCAAPFVNRSAYFGFGPEEGGKLAKWLERVRVRESVKMTFDEFRVAAGKMGDMKGPFERGERKREYRDSRLEWLVKSGGIEIVQRGLEKKNIRFVWPEAKL